jgi:hypothetical protein
MWFDILKLVDVPLGFSSDEVEKNLEQELMFNNMDAGLAKELTRRVNKFYNRHTKKIDEVKLKQAIMSTSYAYPEKLFELVMNTLGGNYSKDPNLDLEWEGERYAHDTPKEEWPKRGWGT